MVKLRSQKLGKFSGGYEIDSIILKKIQCQSYVT